VLWIGPLVVLGTCFRSRPGEVDVTVLEANVPRTVSTGAKE